MLHVHIDLLVSGSRDGSFALWDLRCKSDSTNRRGEPRILYDPCAKLILLCSYGVVHGPHNEPIVCKFYVHYS